MTNVTMPTEASVEEFIEAVENKRRKQDAMTLLELFKEVTKLPAVMWGPSIVGFGQYHYKYDSGREGEMLAAGFSPRKANLSVYVGDGFDGAADLYKKLGKFKKSKACLYINKLDNVDMDVLKQIVDLDFRHTLAKHSG